MYSEPEKRDSVDSETLTNHYLIKKSENTVELPYPKSVRHYGRHVDYEQNTSSSVL